MPVWAWVLVGWVVVAVPTAIILGRLLKRNRERTQIEEEFWKDQTRRSRSRWN
jgi:hypothetical protein